MGLRIYPLPYISLRLRANQLGYIATETNKLANEAVGGNLRAAQDRMTACLGFADIYGKEDQFLKITGNKFKYDQTHEFVHGPKRIKVLVSRANEKWENTGFRMKFRMRADTFRTCKTDWFILAAYHVPYVELIGWMTKDDLTPCLKGWAVEVYPTLPKLKPMADLSLESSRRKGTFV